MISILNLRTDKIIMGLDNSSPYFNPLGIISRIKDTSAIVYGGLVFQLPLLGSLQKLGISPELLSNIYVFLNLISGTFGFALLIKRFFKSQTITIVGTIILLTNLLVFWIFAHPNFMFIAAFGSIPILVFILTKRQLSIWNIIFLVIASISFLTTTLNLVAFFSYLLCIGLLSLILSSNPKKAFKTFCIWALSISIVWIGTIQTIMYINNDKTFFPSRIYEYTQELLENPSVTSSTNGIIASEKTNTLIRTMSFALGWMELHDSTNTPIFEHYSTYRENIFFIFLGVLPFALATVAVFLKPDRKILLLTALLLLFTFFCSKYGITLLEKIPYLGNAFRWSSSKFWPLYIFPLLILSLTSLQSFVEHKSFILKTIISLLIIIPSIIYGAPVLNGNLLSSKTLINIPNEYFNIPKNSSILILPHPQKLYMREYDWGYYGSDFLVHITNSEIIDGANLFEYAKKYEEILETQKIPENIEYVLYDHSAETNLEEDILKKSHSLVKDLDIINSNEYFTIYGR